MNNLVHVMNLQTKLCCWYSSCGFHC